LLTTDALIVEKDTELNTYIGAASANLVSTIPTDIAANILGTDSTATLLTLLNQVVANQERRNEYFRELTYRL
jgi:hypothetical protein